MIWKRIEEAPGKLSLYGPVKYPLRAQREVSKCTHKVLIWSLRITASPSGTPMDADRRPDAGASLRKEDYRVVSLGHE
jgi:hypothetical protein